MRRRDARNLDEAATAPAWLPPAWLCAPAAIVWAETVAAVAPGFFSQSDSGLLAVYCHRFARLRALMALEAKAALRTRLQREQADQLAREVRAETCALLPLARALRLTVVSRRQDESGDKSLPPSNDGRRALRGRVVRLAASAQSDLLP